MLQSLALQPQLIDAFSRLIADHLGFHLREQSRSTFWQRVLQRVRALGLPSVEAYYHLLNVSHQSIVENPEWRELISLLSVTESYFFRDEGQFSLVKSHILPELIARKQKLAAMGHPEGRSLKLWSAGCATGEEAYSLAILLKQLIPDYEDWTIAIVGTDINQTALLQAQRGIYSDWSFRSIQPDIQEQYFKYHYQGWRITTDVSKLVTFKLDNLVHCDHIEAQSSLSNIDLILCRNVFIYFDADAIARVLERFYCALSPGSYLMTGHTELHGQKYDRFKLKIFSESVVYQREIETIPSSLKPLPKPNKNFSFRPPIFNKSDAEGSPGLKDLESSTTDINEGAILLEAAIVSLNHKDYTSAIAQAKRLITQDLYPLRAYCLLAEAHANLGQYEKAMQACQQAFEYDPLAAEPIYLLAQIAQEQGDLESAKALLKRIIYLVPTSAFAYFELGCLYEQQGNLAKAQRNWQSSLNGLKNVSGETMIDGCRGLIAKELQGVIEQKMSQEILRR